LNFIKELKGSNAHVPLALPHHFHICRPIIQHYDLCNAPNKSWFVSLKSNNGLAQKTNCTNLCCTTNSDSLDGFFRHTLTAFPHAQSINDYCLAINDIIRDNKHATAMMLDTRSTISGGSKAKNSTIMD
jgi:hypothetical protein